MLGWVGGTASVADGDCWGLKPDVAEDVGYPVVKAADPVQGENGAHRQSPTPLLVTAVLHLDVDEDV